MTFSRTVFPLLAHVGSGAVLFVVLAPVLRTLPESQMLALSSAGFLLIMGIRLRRFNRVAEVLRFGPHSSWVWQAIFSLLGPAEFLVPLLWKSERVGLPAVWTIVAFGFGTVLTGAWLVASRRRSWSIPAYLPRAFLLETRLRGVAPVAATLLLGLAFVLAKQSY